jgi:hypothetical protein
MKSFYIIGSLRNPEVPIFANKLRAIGYEAVDAWYSSGPRADDHWQEHSNLRGQTFKEALADHAAQNVFKFDKRLIDKSDAVVLLLPAGKSGHLELGYAIGTGKPGYIIFDAVPERYDVMYNFATDLFFSQEELFDYLKEK